MTSVLVAEVGSATLKSKAVKRTEQTRYLRVFLRTPLAWALLLLLVGAVAAEARHREGNRLACASVAMLMDRQIFREKIAGPGRAEVRVLRACVEYATFTTYDTNNIPPLSTVRRISDGLP